MDYMNYCSINPRIKISRKQFRIKIDDVKRLQELEVELNLHRKASAKVSEIDFKELAQLEVPEGLSISVEKEHLECNIKILRLTAEREYDMKIAENLEETVKIRERMRTHKSMLSVYSVKIMEKVILKEVEDIYEPWMEENDMKENKNKKKNKNGGDKTTLMTIPFEDISKTYTDPNETQTEPDIIEVTINADVKPEFKLETKPELKPDTKTEDQHPKTWKTVATCCPFTNQNKTSTKITLATKNIKTNRPYPRRRHRFDHGSCSNS